METLPPPDEVVGKVVRDGGIAQLVRARMVRLGSVVRARAATTIREAFTFTPPEEPRDRPDDERFHGARPERAAVALAQIPSSDIGALISRALAEIPEKGEGRMPKNVALLARLLDDPPPDDFAADDMLRACFEGYGPSLPASRPLLAVARQMARHFARPTRMPLATVRAWRMLDPVLFETEMAAQLAVIGRFILDWQKTQQNFLCLEHGEIELIEHLFESLHPAHFPKEMADVLDFKVLSNRRQGLLRRVPHRLRKAVSDPGPRDGVLDLMTATQAFLGDIAGSRHYRPIVDAAIAALEEVNKLAEKLVPAQPALPAPDAAGQPLARIAPVKMPASERPGQAAAPPPAAAPPRPVMASPPAVAAPPAPRAEGVSSFLPVPVRFPPGGGPRFAVAAPSLPVGTSIKAVADRRPPTMLSSRLDLASTRKRADFPAFLMAPLPSLASPTAATASLSGSVADLTVVPSAKRPSITQAVKRQSVLKVLRGEPSAAVAAALGIRASKLDEWVDAFLAAGAGALSPAPKPKRTRKTEPEPLTTELLRAKLAEVMATAQLIERVMDEVPTRSIPRPILLPPPGRDDKGPAAPRKGHRKA